MDQGADVKKIPLVLITGFLGSGKTSLLKNLLSKAPPDIRIAIVQNEFAPGKTDSVELEATSRAFHLLEVNNGSVFCACLLENFISQLESFLSAVQPQILFIEATGMADPVSLGEILQSPEVSDRIFLGGIWTVVDLVNFSRSLQFVTRVRHQIQMADLLLLNKSDIHHPEESVLTQLRTWNPGAEISESHFGDFNDLDNQLRKILSPTHPQSLRLPDPTLRSEGRPDLDSAVIRTQRPVEIQKIRNFIENNAPRIIRMKGFIRNANKEIYLIQLIFDQLTIQPVTFWTGGTELIVMGSGIRAREVLKQLSE